MAVNMDTLLRLRVAVDGENNIRRLSGDLKGLERAAGSVSSGFNAMRAASAALASSAVVAGLTGIIKNAIDAGDELNNLQMKTGIAADALLGLRAAAKLGDVDTAMLAKGLNRLNVVIAEAAAGNQQSADKFKGLGVSIRDASGQVASTDVVFKRLADRFRDMPDGAGKAAAAAALFGTKMGAEFIPVLNEGSMAMDNLNVKIGDDFPARSDQFNDTLTVMGLKTEAMGLELTEALLPALQSILNEFSNLFDTKEDWSLLFETIKIGVRSLATFVFASIKLVDQLIKSVQTLAGAFGAITAGDFGLAFNILKERGGNQLQQAIADFESIGRMWTDAAAPPSSSRRGGRQADTATMRGIDDQPAGGRRGGGGATRIPEYIDKSVLRNWLMSQGFGRTSGDFTNAGHQTPNHMLNAMDMGILGGSDADALRKTAAMERALQATGAFGSQLFGPTRDPYGHGAGKGGQNIHLHIPTPGGKVKMTEGLAQLMGMDGGAASWKKFQQDEKQASDKAERLQRTMQDQLLTSRERLGAAEHTLRIAEAQTDEQKLQAEFDAERSDRITRYAALLRDSLSVEERANILKAQYREGSAAEMEFEKQISEARQKSYEATLLQIEAQREAMTQMGDALGGQVFGTPDIVAPGDQQFSPFAGYVEGIGSMNEALNGLATTGFKGIEDAMVSLATTGKANFREFAAALLEDTARLIIQQLVLKTILSAIGGGGPSFGGIPGFAPSTGNLMDGFSGFNPGAFSMSGLSGGLGFSPGIGFARGGVFARNGVVPFANGGIVNRPTLFPFARGGTFGTGVMGEAGPEAILPLKRGRDGRLGVAGGGGGDINISVQVDAGGTNAEGNADTGRQLANVVANAVKTEMIRQKRPGGILSK